MDERARLQERLREAKADAARFEAEDFGVMALVSQREADEYARRLAG